MTRSLIVGGLAVALLAAIAVVALADGGGSSTAPSTYELPYGMARVAVKAPAPASSDVEVAVADHGLGRMLVDGEGRTLYLWRADATPMGRCSAACAEAWPPETTTASVRAGRGVDGNLLGLVKRDAATRQVTYAGHPLYRFAGDRAAGQAGGQGSAAFGAEWWAVDPAGSAITTAG